MRVSKTLFMHFMRCNRFAGLYETYKNKVHAVVDFDESSELEALMSLENKNKTLALVDAIEHAYGEDDPMHQVSEQMEVMMPYYKELELIAGSAIKNMFKGDVTYSLETKNQKQISHVKDGYEFYAFLDAYQEDASTIRIIEVKATTDKKYLDLMYTNIDGEKVPVFEKTPQGFLTFKDLPEHQQTKTYQSKVRKLMNRLEKEGRYIYDIAYQYAIQALKYPDEKKPMKAFLAVLNSNYYFDGTMIDGKPNYEHSIISFLDVTSLVNKMFPIIVSDMAIVVERLNNNYAGKVPLGKHCQRGDVRQCPFYDICHAHIPEKHSVFSYIGRQFGFNNGHEKIELYDYINRGDVHMQDIPISYLNRETNQIQRQVLESNKPYVNKKRIQVFIEDIKYPLYHLDFESFPCPLPRFKDEKPYMQSLFQFSVHVEKTPGKCDLFKDHTQYLANDASDHRLNLVKKLCEVIPMDGGSVMVYHEQFEKGRLEELSIMFPEYSTHLLDIRDRIIDLKLFLKGSKKRHEALGIEDTEGFNFYDATMDGSFSIKKILPVFTNISYKDLEVQNGTEALTQFAKMPSMSKELQKETYEHLTAYCRQDTYAMFKILEGLRNEIYDKPIEHL